MSPEQPKPTDRIFERLKRVVESNPNSVEIVDFYSSNLPSGMCSADRVILAGLDHQAGTVRSVNFSIYEEYIDFSRGFVEIEYSDEETSEIYLGNLIESAGGLIQENRDGIDAFGVEFRRRTPLEVQFPLEVARKKTKGSPQIIAIFKEKDQIIMANISPIQLEEIEQIKTGDGRLEEASGALDNSLEALLEGGAKMSNVPFRVNSDVRDTLSAMQLRFPSEIILCNFSEDFVKYVDDVNFDAIVDNDLYYGAVWMFRTASRRDIGSVVFKGMRRVVENSEQILRQSDGSVNISTGNGFRDMTTLDQPFEIASGRMEQLVPVIYRDKENVYHFTNITKEEARRLKEADKTPSNVIDELVEKVKNNPSEAPTVPLRVDWYVSARSSLMTSFAKEIIVSGLGHQSQSDTKQASLFMDIKDRLSLSVEYGDGKSDIILIEGFNPNCSSFKSNQIRAALISGPSWSYVSNCETGKSEFSLEKGKTIPVVFVKDGKLYIFNVEKSDLEVHEESRQDHTSVVQQPRVIEHKEEVVKPNVVGPTVLEPRSKSVPTGTIIVPSQAGESFSTRRYSPNDGPVRRSPEQQIEMHQDALRELMQGNKGKKTKEQIAYHRREISRLTNPKNKKPHSRRHW